jgi:hypothetical protein
MSLKIGFANTFYTLWDVSSEDCYSTTPNGVHYLSHTKTNYFYFQNLSKTLEVAIEKAKEKGCTDLVPSDSLRGHSRSFSDTITHPKPLYADWQFVNGKYEGQDIRLSNDLKYLLWYYNEKDCLVSAARVCELDSFYTLVDGKLLTAGDLILRDIRQGKYELEAVSNFKGDEDGYTWINVKIEAKTDDEQKVMDENPYGIQISILSEGLNLIRKEYKGFVYFTPKGMRSFKGKKFTINNQIIKIN